MRKVLIAALLIAALLIPGLALAQAFPTKPIRLLVPFGPGGVADLVASTIAPTPARPSWH